MNKKGISQNVVVDLIIVAVFLGIMILLLILTGVMNKLMEYASIMLCMVSSLVRSIFISIVFMLLAPVVTYFIYLSILTASKVKGRMWAGSIFSAGKLTIGALIVTLMINTVIVNLPLVCPHIDTTVGSIQKPIYYSDFVDDFSSKIVSTYDMFGGGKFDPLVGLKPNPRIAFSVVYHLTEDVNLTKFYADMYEKYNKSWRFGDVNHPNIYLFCENGEDVTYLGDDTSKWQRCEFNEAIIYVMYMDKYNIDLLKSWSGYGYYSGVCKGKIDPSLFGDGDSIVLCVDVLGE